MTATFAGPPRGPDLHQLEALAVVAALAAIHFAMILLALHKVAPQ